MAKIRNISGEARAVPELNWRTVDPDEVVEVPNDRLEAYVSQTTTWADESDSKKKEA